MSCNRQFLARGETLGLLYIEGGIVGTDSDSDTHRRSRANLERLAIAVGERMSLGAGQSKNSSQSFAISPFGILSQGPLTVATWKNR